MTYKRAVPVNERVCLESDCVLLSDGRAVVLNTEVIQHVGDFMYPFFNVHTNMPNLPSSLV